MQNKFLFLGIFEVLQKAAVPTEKRGPQNVFYRSLGSCPGIFFAWWGTVYHKAAFTVAYHFLKIYFWKRYFPVGSEKSNLLQDCASKCTAVSKTFGASLIDTHPWWKSIFLLVKFWMFFWENTMSNILKQFYSLRIVFHILQVTCLEISKLQTLCMPMRGVSKRTCRLLKGVRSSIKLQNNVITWFISKVLLSTLYYFFPFTSYCIIK